MDNNSVFSRGADLPRRLRGWPDLSIDLETLDTKPTAVITQIGLCFFDRETQQIGPSFKINVAALLQPRRSISWKTLKWWSQQSKQAKGQMLHGQLDADTPRRAMRRLGHLVKHYASEDVRVYGKGSDFDNALLQDLYKSYGREAPWKFWNNRCLRTATDFAGPQEKIEFAGTPHNAQSDAIHQAKLMMQAWAAIPPATTAMGDAPIQRGDTVRIKQEDRIVFTLAMYKGHEHLRTRSRKLGQFVWTPSERATLIRRNPNASAATVEAN